MLAELVVPVSAKLYGSYRRLSSRQSPDSDSLKAVVATGGSDTRNPQKSVGRLVVSKPTGCDTFG